MAGGRKAKVPRNAHESPKSVATLRIKLTVRLMEVLYPYPRNGAAPYVREIKYKWIYIFYQASGSSSLSLEDEIYADADQWERMRQPGKALDREEAGNAVPYPYPAGYAGIRDEEGCYGFFLSPVQLGPETIGDMLQYSLPGSSYNWKESNLSETPVKTYAPYYFYKTSGFFDEHAQFTAHSYAHRNADKLYVVLVPDPFAWAEDIQILGYQPSLAASDGYLPKAKQETLIAQTFQGAMKVEDDTLGLENEFAEKNDWFDCEGRSEAPRFQIKTEHPDDRRVLSDSAHPNESEWKGLPGGSQDVLELRIKMFESEYASAMELPYKYAKTLAQWMSGRRHKTVERACMELEGDALELATVHWAKATVRLGEVAPGQKFLLTIYKSEADRFVHRMLEQAEPQSPGEWWKEKGPMRNVGLSAFKLIENFAGAIAVSEGDNFGKKLRSILGMPIFGFSWKPPDPEAVPMVWKRPAVSLKNPTLEVPKGTVLSDGKEVFKKYHVKQWFTGIGIGVSVINWVVTVNEVMEGKASTPEKIKLAFETVGLGLEGQKFRLELRLGEEAEKDLAVKGLSRAGAAIGAITAAVDFYVAVDAAGQAYFMDRNYAVTVVQVLAATSAAVAVTAGVFSLCFGEAVSGPIGWIALGLTLVGLLLAWLAKKSARNKWEEVAYYSYLGKGYLKGKGEGFYKEYFNNSTAHSFGKHVDWQSRSLTGLMAAFNIEAKGYADALNGRIKITPGWVEPKSVFRFRWQFGYGFHSAQWITIKAAVRVSDFELVSEEIEFKNFGNLDQGRIEWEAYTSGEGPTGIEFFSIRPRLVDSAYSHSIPFSTTVMVQLAPSGDGGPTIPYEKDFEVERGPFQAKYSNWLGYAVSTANESVEIQLQGT